MGSVPMFPDGLAHAGCVCSGLVQKFHAAGIPTAHAGWAGHEPRHALSPNPPTLISGSVG